MDIATALAETPVSELELTRYVTVGPDATVRETVAEMCDAARSCACITEEDHLRGIFTQRDVLLRAVGRPSTWDRPISEEMTRSVRTMTASESVADGMAVMNDWWVRSVPVLDDGSRLTGVLSYYTVMNLIADLFAQKPDDAGTEATLRHGLGLIDFTGLHVSPAVTVQPSDPVETAAHHMKARGIGSLMVVDDRHHLVGVLTEFDLQMKVGCSEADLSTIRVEEVMTTDPVAISVRSSVVDAITEMATHAFSHVPLLGESARPVGVVSFRDIVGYAGATMSAMG